MPGFDGTGPAGMGPMTGGGRGYCSPRGIGAGRRGYAFPRWPRYGRTYYGTGPYPFGVGAYTPAMTAEEELEGLRAESQQIARHLDDIQRRIADLEK